MRAWLRMVSVMAPDEVLTVYEFQLFVFAKAVELGWPGRQPLILANPEADEAFQDAYRFLKSLEGNEALWKTLSTSDVRSDSGGTQAF